MTTIIDYTILIVDDQSSNLEVMSELLESHGFKVLSARDSKAALEIAQLTLPDLILLDVVLPGMDGFEVCRRLKAEELTKDIPVIFMTILEKIEEKIRGFQVGAVDYITKPFQVEEVLARITTQLHIRSLTRELQEANQTLERRVEKRTAQLAQVNEDLQAEVVERKLAEEAEQRRRQIAETLVKAAAVLNSTLDLDQVLDLILQQLYRAIDYDSASFLERKADYLMISACQKFRKPHEVIGVKFTLDPRLPIYHVVTKKMPLHLTDVGQDYPHFRDQKITDQALHIHTWLGVPVLSNDDVIGVIALDRCEVNPFTNEDIELATAFANQAAIAIENARLHKQTQRHATELERRVKERTSDLQQEILERKRVEEALRERTMQLGETNEQLRVLSQVKDEFVSNVSHELRTPITNLKLRQYLLAQQPDKWEEHLAVISRETKRLEQIIESLLYLSRLDQERISWNPSPVDLNLLASQLVRDRTALAQSRELNLTFIGESNLPLVEVDVALWEQALSILLTNALNYTPDGGQIEVRTQVREQEGQRLAGVSVSDTGPGIPPYEQTRLFERFFRGKAGRESGAPGTGLGLSIVREIVNKYGGQVEVYSEGMPGKGATFSLWLSAA